MPHFGHMFLFESVMMSGSRFGMGIRIKVVRTAFFGYESKILILFS